MNGWTKDLSQQERDENELRAIGEMLQSDPANEYWRARFEGVPYPVDEAQEAEEIGEVLQWVGVQSVGIHPDDEKDWQDQVTELRNQL
jgi:hypothetical protein